MATPDASCTSCCSRLSPRARRRAHSSSLEASLWRSSAMISPSLFSRSARRFSAAVAAAIAAAASATLPSPTLRTDLLSSSSSASRLARSAASARARAASAAPASASARTRASSASAFASVSSTSSCASRFSKDAAELAARSSAACFASSSASSADFDSETAAAFSAPSLSTRVSASASFASAAAARFSKASASRARAAAAANARTAAFSSPPVDANEASSEASGRTFLASDAFAEAAKISSRGVPLRIRSSTSYVLSAFLVFLSSPRAALARALCSCASARASMPSRCACSATPRSRSLCAASVSCTCSRYSTWHCARRITLRALDVVRYRESSTETSPNVTVSCGRRRAGQIVGLRLSDEFPRVRASGVACELRRGRRRRRDDVKKWSLDERAHRVGTRGRARDAPGRSRGCRCRFRASCGRRRPRGWRASPCARVAPRTRTRGARPRVHPTQPRRPRGRPRPAPPSRGSLQTHR